MVADAAAIARLQRRTVAVLAAATVLGGLGVGASASVGALLIAQVSGHDGFSGLAAATSNAGAALAGIPLARLAAKHGRRKAVVTGSLLAALGGVVAILGAALGWWIILTAGIGMLGIAAAVQLLSRFAATDLAIPEKRARDLSLVVWAITVGAVVGPNLLVPGEAVGAWLGVTPLAGVFCFTVLAQLLAALVNWWGLRPDPLLSAQKLQALAPQAVADPAQIAAASPAALQSQQASAPAPKYAVLAARFSARSAKIAVVLIIAIAQAMMVALMSMTPLHIMHHQGTAALVGFTISLHIAGMYILSPVFGLLASRFGSLPVLLLGWAILAVSVVLAAISANNFALVQLGMTLLGVGWSAVTVAGSALLTEITALDERASWQGRSDTVMSAAGAVAGLSAGVVFSLSNFAGVAVVGGVLLLVGVVVSAHPHLRPAKQI